MSALFTVALSQIIQELNLDVLYMPCDPQDILLSSKDVSRPGLELTGFFEYYDNTRILIIGNTEMAFLKKYSNGTLRPPIWKADAKNE